MNEKNETKDFTSAVSFPVFDLSWMNSEIKRLRYAVQQVENQISLLPPGSPHLEKSGSTYAIRVLTGHRSDGSRKQIYLSLREVSSAGNNARKLRKNVATPNSIADTDDSVSANNSAAKTEAASRDTIAVMSDTIAVTPGTIAAYANKLYLSRLLPVLKTELDALTAMQKAYHPERKFGVFYELPDEARKRISPAVMQSWERGADWEKAKFPRSQYPFDDSNDLLITKKGERVRSRIELFIANCIFDAGIPYRYECKYFFPDGSIVYPDFTIMHPRTGELYYLEYFGRMDDPAYREKAYEKIRQFQLSKDAAHFLCFMESSSVPLNTQAILNTLNAYFCEDRK